MTLVIEDGSVVAGANSFVTVDEIKLFASGRGVTLPATDAQIEALALNAASYIQNLEPRMSGQRVKAFEQTLCYPREGAYFYGKTFPSDDVPMNLRLAQMQLCCDQAEGVSLFPDDTQGFAIKREKTGPLETEYATGGLATGAFSPRLEQANGYLKPLLVGSGMSALTLRI